VDIIFHLLARGLGAMIIPYLLTYFIMRRNKNKKLSRHEIFITFMIVWISITVLRVFIPSERIYTLLVIIIPIITINYFMKRSTYDEGNWGIGRMLML